MNTFKTLNKINVNENTESITTSKGVKLTYLSWAWAWTELKKAYPDATSCVYENADGWNYHTDGRTAWVKTGVTIDGLEHIEYLPVLDYRNQAIPLDKLTSMQVNTSIQRSTTKAIARHGLGLYIYAGEDLPDIPVWKDGERDTYEAEIKKSIVGKKGETDYENVKQLWRELTKRQVTDIWKEFDNHEHIIIKDACRDFDTKEKK